jgi:hypothetical protein
LGGRICSTRSSAAKGSITANKTIAGAREVEKTANGAEKYWELGRCLRENRLPLERGVKQNLAFLIELRDEIEHRSTNRIDDTVSAKLQACCINFNDSIKQLFGPQFGLERRLPTIATELHKGFGPLWDSRTTATGREIVVENSRARRRPTHSLEDGFLLAHRRVWSWQMSLLVPTLTGRTPRAARRSSIFAESRVTRT